MKPLAWRSGGRVPLAIAHSSVSALASSSSAQWAGTLKTTGSCSRSRAASTESSHIYVLQCSSHEAKTRGDHPEVRDQGEGPLPG